MSMQEAFAAAETHKPQGLLNGSKWGYQLRKDGVYWREETDDGPNDSPACASR